MFYYHTVPLMVRDMVNGKAGVLLFVMGFFLLYSQYGNDAVACSCLLLHPLDRLERNDAVFAGTVTDLAYLGEKGYVTIEVDRIWKGVSEKSITILDDRAGGCAVNFMMGEQYIVYASNKQGIFGESTLGTYLCQGTRNLSLTSVFDDIEILGEGYAPTSSEGQNFFAGARLSLVSFLSSSALIVTAAIAVGTASLVLLLLRRQDKKAEK